MSRVGRVSGAGASGLEMSGGRQIVMLTDFHFSETRGCSVRVDRAEGGRTKKIKE